MLQTTREVRIEQQTTINDTRELPRLATHQSGSIEREVRLQLLRFANWRVLSTCPSVIHKKERRSPLTPIEAGVEFLASISSLLLFPLHVPFYFLGYFLTRNPRELGIQNIRDIYINPSTKSYEE